MSSINHQMIELARKIRGLSQTDLVSDLKPSITQATLSKIERGDLTPSSELLEGIASKLKFPIDFFKQRQNIAAIPISFHAYRKKAAVSKSNLDKIHAELNLKIMHAHVLEQVTDVPVLLPLPQVELHKFRGSPEMVARHVRDLWCLGDDPIENLVDLVERSGVLIFECDFPEGLVDGVTIRTEHTSPCIFLNTNQPNDRMRFTLAHELGHIIMHKNPSVTMETEANAFAAELLMPAHRLKEELATTKLLKYAELKSKWKTSMASLIYRASTLNAITESQNTYLWRQMSTLGYRKHEPVELPKEPCSRVGILMWEYALAAKQDFDQLADVFSISRADFESFYQHDLMVVRNTLMS